MRSQKLSALSTILILLNALTVSCLTRVLTRCGHCLALLLSHVVLSFHRFIHFMALRIIGVLFRSCLPWKVLPICPCVLFVLNGSPRFFKCHLKFECWVRWMLVRLLCFDCFLSSYVHFVSIQTSKNMVSRYIMLYYLLQSIFYVKHAWVFHMKDLIYWNSAIRVFHWQGLALMVYVFISEYWFILYSWWF